MDGKQGFDDDQSSSGRIGFAMMSHLENDHQASTSAGPICLTSGGIVRRSKQFRLGSATKPLFLKNKMSCCCPEQSDQHGAYGQRQVPGHGACNELQTKRSESDARFHGVLAAISIDVQATRTYIRVVFILWSPSWAVVPATVVASLGRTPLQQDNAEFLSAVICLLRMMVSH